MYDAVWAGLRPGIKVRIKPFAVEDGRFASIDELFKKAQDVEIRSNQDKRVGTTQKQPATLAEKKHGYNGGNNVGNNGGDNGGYNGGDNGAYNGGNNGSYNGGNNGGKDKKKWPYHDTQSPTPSRNYSHCESTPSTLGRQRDA
jgi:hypothetical protein